MRYPATKPVGPKGRAGWLLAAMLGFAGVTGAVRATPDPAAAASADSIPAAGSGATSADQYKQMSLDQLMDLDVTSVSREPEPYEDAAAAIDVITNDAIARSGATSLPESLRLADNLEVAQENSHDWAISARGFDANLANKLLVLIDGRAVYTPLYGGVLWNVQDYPLQDVDRIEVVSGPGGTLWGANAVNGVINVVSKSAKDTQGLYLEEDAGTELRDLTSVRYGGALGTGAFYRVYAEYSDHESEVFGNGADADDSWDMSRAGFRVDSDTAEPGSLTLQGDIYHGTEFLGAIGDGDLAGGNLLGRWTRTFSDSSDMSLQIYYDRTHISQPLAASPPAPPYYTGFPAASLVDDLDTYDAEFQDRLKFASINEVTWGLSYRFTHEADEDPSVVQFSPSVLDQNLFGAFLQDEIRLAENARLTVGSKLEHNDYTGFEVEPSIRGQLSLPGRQSLWAAISRAVRTPSRYDRDLIVPTGLVNAPPPFQFPTAYLTGNPNFKSESVVAYEIGYRAEFGSQTSASISTFYNDYYDLRSTTSTPATPTYPFPYPVYFQNNLEGDTYGAELNVTYRITEGWQLHGGYDLMKENIHPRPGQTDDTGGLNETADPGHQGSLRSSWDFPGNVHLDAAMRWIGPLTIDNGPTSGPVAGTVPGYHELDARIAWQPLKQIELSLVGENLLHARHQEYGFPSPTTEYIERSGYGKVVWHY
jgi:iron complex outermembrane receptor protein